MNGCCASAEVTVTDKAASRGAGHVGWERGGPCKMAAEEKTDVAPSPPVSPWASVQVVKQILSFGREILKDKKLS